MMKKLLTYTITALLLLTACCKDDKEETDGLSERTVLVYMSGENDLSSCIEYDINEMLEADTKNRDHVLLVYVDDVDSKRTPYLARIRNGKMTDSISIKDMGITRYKDTCSVDPGVMRDIINYAFRKYASRNNDYGLVLWGHASGWIIKDSVAPRKTMADIRRRAYGYDNGTNSYTVGAWINMYSLAEVLSQVPHLKFLFADCCNFQCLESAYELRNVADYIIASPSEIPAMGAPYKTVVPALFERDTFYTAIIDRYYEQTLSSGRRVPLSAVKTSAMNNLAEATRTVLQSMKDTLTAYPDVSGLIHYYYSPLFNDANDFILRYAKPDAYTTWKKALDEAIVYKKMATMWDTNTYWWYNYSDFEMTEERYGGISMFVPQDPKLRGDYQQHNNNISKTSWYYAVGLKDLGW